MKKLYVILLFMVFLPNIFIQADELERIGAYSNLFSSDGLMAEGFTIHLWRQNVKMVGVLSFQMGEIGFIEKGELKGIVFTKDTGDLKFFVNLPESGKIAFLGKFSSNLISGNFEFLEGTYPDYRNQQLVPCCDDAPIFKDYSSFIMWKQDWLPE